MFQNLKIELPKFDSEATGFRDEAVVRLNQKLRNINPFGFKNRAQYENDCVDVCLFVLIQKN